MSDNPTSSHPLRGLSLSSARLISTLIKYPIPVTMSDNLTAKVQNVKSFMYLSRRLTQLVVGSIIE